MTVLDGGISVALYFMLFCTSTIVSVADLSGVAQKYRRIILLVFALVCLLMGTIRYHTGSDWDSYFTYWYFDYSLNNFLFGNEMETGYAWINFVIKSIFDSYPVLLFILSGITIFCYYKASWKLTPYPLVLAMILYSSDFYGIFPIRSTVAVSLTYLSCVMAVKKRFVPFLILVLLATEIHRTAIIFLPAYFLFQYRLSGKVLLICCLASMGIGYSGLFIQLLSNFVGVDSVYLSRAISYVQAAQSGDQFGSTFDKETMVYVSGAIKVLAICLLLRFRSVLVERIPNFNGLFQCFIFGSCLLFMTGMDSPEIGIRLSAYYVFLQYTLMASSINIVNEKRKVIRVIIWGGLVVSCAARLYFKFIGLPDAYLPFRTIFD